MNLEQQMVLEFHKTVGHGWQATPNVGISVTLKNLRRALIAEEFRELVKAMDDQDMVAIADGLADLLYVVYGCAIAYGIDMEPVFAEVHRANMRKVGGSHRADGKQLKPEGWQGPDIQGILNTLATQPLE
jgi:predicted HAD superfamily Cof-like phosphohydrolase